ncbi:hypothetical protein [Candidatus Tisiphia endosymbiont of Nemotelus uliginosus]|uniref:hypothetical protein n=1 Tax=Candidatus Tisiphia endosymbiont of Nemotelus uliginosus TaxID=3077926 RepID=UPI0035C8A0A1
MPRDPVTALEKLKKIEEKKQKVLITRREDLLEIVNSCNAMTIDDQLLAGFLLFAMNEQNKQHPILKEFIQLAKTTLDPRKLLAKKHRAAKTNSKTNG